METDDLLVRRTLAGDKSAFGVLIDRHRPEVLRLARHVLRGAVDAEDCVQEAFLHALLGLRELRAPDRFLAWVLGRWPCPSRGSRRPTIPASSSTRSARGTTTGAPRATRLG